MAIHEAPLLHVVILPWLAFGHMIPLLNLAISLANAGLRISFLSTPRNAARLPKIPGNLTSLINVIQFPLPSISGLPETGEATVDVSFDQQEYLKLAYDKLKHPIKQYLVQLQQQGNQPPLCIIHDFLPYWIIDIGQVLNIPCIGFSVFSASAFAFFIGPPPPPSESHQQSPRNLTEKPEWIPFPSTVAFRPHEAKILIQSMSPVNVSGVSDMERARILLQGCSAIAMRGCSESYEAEYLELLQKLYDPKPVIPTGILLPPPPPPESSTESKKQEDGCWGKIFKWLDSQKPKSVVFVSFGSEYTLSETEIDELAYGLELSNIPFIWALRNKPISWTVTEPEEDDGGFVRRGAHNQGIVAFGWAPQMDILAHPSIGGSLFHSGWGSIIETLRYGHVLIVMPSIFDQGLNARLIVEKGLGVEVEKDEDGGLNREVIARCLVTAMVSVEGEGMRKKAREMGCVYGDQAIQDQYVKGLIEYLVKVSVN